MLNLVWIMPFISVVPKSVSVAWKLAGCFIPISYGWAAGDVSLAAYIQSTLAKIENVDRDSSALGAVMAFVSCARPAAPPSSFWTADSHHPPGRFRSSTSPTSSSTPSSHLSSAIGLINTSPQDTPAERLSYTSEGSNSP
jgi:hypothetical protein